MKHVIATILALISFSFCIAGCNKDDSTTATQNTNDNGNNDITSNKIKITVGSTVFTATLYDNPTATAFKRTLPLTINMSELNGNEKFYYFSTTFPTNASEIENIQAGDLMLYGNNCLVLFYESFKTSYSYTRLGRIDSISGLTAALGPGSVNIKFELE